MLWRMKRMYKSEIDLPVLLIFFARPSTLEKVFNEVKKARPSKLFLACDGPRENREDDKEAVRLCKQIVDDIDWECEVFHRYADENLGCGEGPMSAISWAFENTDRLLIIEDDCVVNPTLFPYMKELLDRYENDQRIGIISGFNHFKDWDCGENSYCFTKCGATLAWGTWKRVWDCYDYNVSGIKNPYYNKLIEAELINKKAGKKRVKSWECAAKETLEKKVNYWDIQFGFVKYSQSLLCIVPKSNLVYNIGVGSGSTHTEKCDYNTWKPGRIMFMPTTDMDFPLVHPKYVLCDREYDEKYLSKMAYKGFTKKLINKVKRMIIK